VNPALRTFVLAGLLSVALSGAARDAIAGCPSTAGCPQPAVSGLEPDNDTMAAILEAASLAQLGSDAPAYPDIEVGSPTAEMVPAILPCVLMKSIGWTESRWTQFCGGNGNIGPTIISFDCGYGVSQVTSGMSSGNMGSFTFSPARVAAEAAYNIGTGAGILAAKWNVVPAVGDKQPNISEHWYYAVWAYNGFSYINNPNNPTYPAGRPPYQSAGGLSRGKYPYQEIVWGFAAHPPQGLWSPADLSYPDNGAIGSSPGAIPAPALVHTDSCSEALIVDNQDPGFSFLKGADGVEQETVAGYDGDYYYSVPYSSSTDYRRATWTPNVPATGLFALDVWIPAGGAVASESARFDLAYWGGHEVTTVNQSTGLGDWRELFPGQTFKLLEGTYGNVSLSNATGGEPGDYVAWDAVRWRSAGSEGSRGSGEQCSSSARCLGALVCVSGVCAPPCDAGSCPDGVCDPATGVCVDGDDDDSGDDDDDSSWGDDDDSAPTAGEDDENWAYGCECNAGRAPQGRGSLYALCVMLVLVLARRRSPAATNRKPNTSQEGAEPTGLPATEA
jgi:hypothetical protein